MRVKSNVWAIGLLSLGLSGTVVAEGLEARVQRLERLQDNQTMLEMVSRMDAMQREIQQLRGQLEEQDHAMDEIRKRQRQLYLDIDRRLTQLERESVGGAPAAGGGTPAAPNGSTGMPAAQPQVKVPTSPPKDIAGEREAYQQAFDLLRDLRYEQASVAFRDFLGKYPNGRYAHIAQYWLGEASYARREFPQAISEYKILISRFPNSPKVPEAMLKIGYSYHELKQSAEARAILDKLIRQFPNSTEAGQARNLLKRL